MTHAGERTEAAENVPADTTLIRRLQVAQVVLSFLWVSVSLNNWKT